MIKTISYSDGNIDPLLLIELLKEKYDLYSGEIVNFNFVGSISLGKIDTVTIDISENFNREMFSKIIESVSNITILITNWNDTPRDSSYEKSFRKSILNTMLYIFLSNNCRLIFMSSTKDNNVINPHSNLFEGLRPMSSQEFHLDMDCNIWQKINGAINDVTKYERSNFILG